MRSTLLRRALRGSLVLQRLLVASPPAPWLSGAAGNALLAVLAAADATASDAIRSRLAAAAPLVHLGGGPRGPRPARPGARPRRPLCTSLLSLPRPRRSHSQRPLEDGTGRLAALDV